MKRLIKFLLCGSVIMLLGVRASVEAQTNEQTSERNENSLTELSNAEQLLGDITQLSQMPQYHVQYTLTNSRSQFKMAHVNVIGNRQTGDAQIMMDFYFKDANPHRYRVEIISYNHFQLVYVKQFELLQTMAFFKQGQFPEKMHATFDAYQNYYVALDPQVIRLDTNAMKWLETLLLTPNVDKLKQISDEDIHQINDISLLSLEKLEIPEYLFENALFPELSYQLDVSMLPDSSSGELTVTSEPKLYLATTHNGAKFSVNANATLEKLTTQVAQIQDLIVGTDKFKRSMELNVAPVATKLKKVQLSLDKGNQVYRAALEGVAENVNLNIFGDSTASFKSYDYRVDYELKPTTKMIPTVMELKRLTQEEFAYIIEQYLEQQGEE